jgi:hypothetical protein
MRPRDGVIHPVEAAQERGFAASGRSDQGRDLVRKDIHTDFVQGCLGSIEEIQFMNGEDGQIIHIVNCNPFLAVAF